MTIPTSFEPANAAMRGSLSPSPQPKGGSLDAAGAAAAAAAGTAAGAAGPAPGKRPQTLARRACDACRARRRKCFFADGPPPQAQSGSQSHSASQPDAHPAVQCHDCLRLGITCSFLVPTRTRGPKRRKRLPSDSRESSDEQPVDEPPATHPEGPDWAYPAAQPEQLKDIRPLAPVIDHSSPFGPSPSHLSGDGSHHGMSPVLVEHVSPSVTSHRFPTDELCSRPLLHVIMNDYLDLIYPLVPIIHRPSFRTNLASNKDIEDQEFFGLVIAIAALTIGLLPSRFPVYHQLMTPDAAARFKTRMAMINCCIDICMRLRTTTYWDNVSHRKWAVCYLLSVGCVQTGQTNRSRMLEVECMQIGRLLGIHRISDYEGLNCIETQLRKKAFWLTFYTYAHAWHQCGRQERLAFIDHSMLHEINFEALFPLEVDDEQIFENKILEHPPAPTSPSTTRNALPPMKTNFTLTGSFNLHSRVFYKSAEIALSPGNCDWARRHTPEEQLSRLRQLLQEIRYMLDDAPGPMRQWASTSDPGATEKPSHTLDGFPARTAARDEWALAQAADVNDANAKALPGQVEIMRANLHGTHLWIQSSLLDRIDVLLQELAQRATSQEDRDAAVAALKASWAEREDVCRQMLHLLHSMPYSYLEPNGLYLTYKVRDVGVALLNCPYEPHERPARRAAEYMQDFARALSRLDRSEIVNTSSLRSWVDTDRDKAFPR